MAKGKEGSTMPFVKAKDGVDIYYEMSGQGTPFLFLSETACDGAVWNLYQTPEFARDHRVVTLDYRGIGLSGKPSCVENVLNLSPSKRLSPPRAPTQSVP